jgi:hypothetical protein
VTTYFGPDTFTGTNGSGLGANWTAALISTTGASCAIQGNQARSNAGTVASYGGKRADRYSGTNRADYEWTGKVTINSSTDGGVEIWIRANTGSPDGTGYFLRIEVGTNTVRLNKAVSFTYTTLQTISGFGSITQGTQYSFKFYVVGTSVKAKFWLTSGSEPGSYQLSTTDSAVAAAGYTYFATAGGGAAGFQADFDDITLTDGTGNAFTFTGSITATGAIQKNITKNPFTGSITPTGVLNKVKVVTKLLTGSITATGAFLKTPNKIFTGSITATGVKIFQVSKLFTASITATGLFRKSSVRVFTGSITAHGTLVVTFLGRVFGRPGILAVRVYKAAELFIRVRRN